MSQLLAQLRQDAARLADEAAPEVVAAIEHLGSTDTVTKLVVALIGRLEESIPGLVKPHDTPLPTALTTHVPTDEEAAEAQQVPPNPTTQTPVQQVPTSAVQVPQTQQTQVGNPSQELEALRVELQREQQKVATLQSLLQPPAADKPVVDTQTQEQTAQ